MVSEQALEMISTEKVGLITHFFPVLTSFFLLIYKYNIWTNIMFYSSLLVFIFTVSYLHAYKVTSGSKYNLQITKGFRDDSLEKFALKTMPLPFRGIFAFISTFFLVLYVWTMIYLFLTFDLNPSLFFILIVMQVSVASIYVLMFLFTRKFLKIFYPGKNDIDKLVKKKR